MNFIIITGYTVDTQYEEEVKDLIRDLKRFELPNKIYPYESKGDWTKNTMVKAELIQRAMETYPDKDIIWIDADAVIMENPELFFELENHDFDICCHHLKTHYNPNELLTGTLILRNNQVTRDLVKDWVNDEEVNWDQKKLQKLVEGKYKNDLTILDLPPEYIKIKTKTEEDVYDIGGIIGHKQASRAQRFMIHHGIKAKGSIFVELKKLFPGIQDKELGRVLNFIRQGHPLDAILMQYKLPQASPQLKKQFRLFRRSFDFSKLKIYEELVDLNTVDVSEIKSFLKDKKKILLIGNNEKFSKKNHAKFVKGFDCVIRINGGVPVENGNTGNKTDIWIYNFPFYEITADEAHDYYEKFSPEFVIRFPLTPGTKLSAQFDNMVLGGITPEHQRAFFRSQLYEKSDGSEVYVDSSTGAKTVDYLLNVLKVEFIHLVGFDFFKTKTYYHTKGTAECHVPKLERNYFKSLYIEGKIKVHDL